MINFLGAESPQRGDTEGLKSAITTAFSRLEISSFSGRLVGFNVDVASVHTGVHAGLGAKATWLVLVHCFNHRI